MKQIWIIPIIMCLLVATGCGRESQEGPKAKKNVLEKKQSQNLLKVDEKDALLKSKVLSATALSLDLTSSVPIRGIQCTIEGTRITEIKTTARSAKLLANFNENTGIVILVSMSGEKIAPGAGSIAEVACDQAANALLTNVKITK